METKKRISKKVLFSKCVEILQPILGLQDWTIVVRYSHKVKTKEVASCEAYPEYKQALIRLHIKKLTNFNDYDMIAIAVHEMTHCILWALVEWTEELCKNDKDKLKVTQRLEESTVTSLEKLLVPLTESILKAKLSEEGYRDLEVVFENFKALSEKKPKIENKT